MHLISGTSSGLGKFLVEHLNGTAYLRNGKMNHLENIEYPFDSIIHCAFNVNRNIHSGNFHHYIQDNIVLTQKLLSIPHKKFIFISTADVYPREEKAWKEDDEFPIENVSGLYGLTKLIAESIIKIHTKDYLILRPTALLGSYSRPNSLMKMLSGEAKELTLSEYSKFNYILHEDVLEFIHIALRNNLDGIYNLASNDEITLADVAKTITHDIQFGSYTYNVAKICNEKVSRICSTFGHTSLKNIERFRTLGV